MLTIDATLSAAMAAGSGSPLARATILSTTYDLYSYKWDNLRFECKISGAVTGDYQDVMTVRRGAQVGGVETLVAIGSFFIESLRKDAAGNTTIVANALPAGAINDVDGDDDALTVLGRVGTYYGLTFHGIPTVQDWLDTWQFFKPDSTLNLVSARLVENLMRQKRRAFLFQRQDGITITNPAVDAANYASIYQFDLPERTTYLDTRLKDLYIFWQDENGFQNSNYAGGSPPASAPKHNLGYVNSAVSAVDVGALGVDGGGQFLFEQFPNLALEQGEPAEASQIGSTSILKFIERFNWPRGTGWRQTVYDQHWQPFGFGDDAITVIQQEFIYNTIEQTIIEELIEQTINNINNTFIEANAAGEISVDTSQFNQILAARHNTLQAVADALDDHWHGPYSWFLYENFF